MRNATQAEQPELRLLHAPSSPQELLEGIFLPDERQWEDKQLPIQEFKGVQKIGGAAVRFTVRVPEVVIDPVPIVYVHGYCASEAAYSDLGNATARNGKISATYESPRSQKNLAGYSFKHILNPERLLAQSVWGVMRGMMEMSKEIGLESEQFDLSGHSMGGRSAVRAALEHQDHVRSVILDEAAGLGKHDTPQLLKALPKFAVDECLPAIRNGSLFSRHHHDVVTGSLHYIARNPYKSLVEGIVVSNCDIRGDLALLGSRGVKTAILVGESDTLISSKATAEHSADIAHLFATYSDPNANHLWPHIKPFETAMTHLQILDALHTVTQQDAPVNLQVAS